MGTAPCPPCADIFSSLVNFAFKLAIPVLLYSLSPVFVSNAARALILLLCDNRKQQFKLLQFNVHPVANLLHAAAETRPPEPGGQ